MAKIMNVDYVAMPKQASQMREHGQKLNDQLSKAYQSIADMHANWFGKRYNSLVMDFNKMIPQLNELLDLVVGDFPFAIETVANNYAQADTGVKVTSAVKTAPRKITELPTPNDVGMRFVTTSVASTQQSVNGNFNTAKELMNTIESDYGRIQWQSEAADAFKTKFRRLKGEIINSFNEISKSFTTLMNQTKDDIQKTENANTVQ